MAATIRWCRCFGLLAAIALAARLEAQTWTATLAGPNESPPNASPGTGHAEMSLAGDLFSINIAFSNLTTGTLASHIHCCTPAPFAGTAGVATMTPTFLGFPLGVTSGTYSHTFDLTQATSFNAAFVTAFGGTAASARAALVDGMNSGHAYLNIHTTQFGAGEIRGFVVATPESGTLLLLTTGLAAVGGFLACSRPRVV
jgi:hypothetical protein